MDRATARALSDVETARATPAFSRRSPPTAWSSATSTASTTNSPRVAGLRLLERETVSDDPAARRAVDRARPDRGPAPGPRRPDRVPRDGCRRRDAPVRGRPGDALLRGVPEGRRLLVERGGGDPDLRRRRHRAQGPPGDGRAVDPRLRRVHDPEPALDRAAAAPTAAAHPHRPDRVRREQHRSSRSAASAGAAIARKAGFSEAVGAAIHDVHEHWDGGGHPRGLARYRHRPPRPDHRGVRRASTSSPRPAAGTRWPSSARARRGSWYDPDVVDALLDACDRGLLDELVAPDLVGRTLDVRAGPSAGVECPTTRRRPPRPGVRRHRRCEEPVHGLALPAGRPRSPRGSPSTWGCRTRTSSTSAEPALLHDIGKLGVPNSILDKPCPPRSKWSSR